MSVSKYPLDEYFEIVQEGENCDTREIFFYGTLFAEGKLSPQSNIGLSVQGSKLHLLFFEISMYLCTCMGGGRFTA